MSEWWSSLHVLTPKQKYRFGVVFGTEFFLPMVKACTKPGFEINTKEYKLFNHTFNYPGVVKWKPITLSFVDMRGDHFYDSNSLEGATELASAVTSGRTTADTLRTRTAPPSPLTNAKIRSASKTLDTADLLMQMLNNSGYMYPYKDAHQLTRLNEGNNYDPKTKRGQDGVESPYFTMSSPEKAAMIANAFGDGLHTGTNWSAAHKAGQIGFGDSAAGKLKRSMQIVLFDPEGVIVEKWIVVNPLIKSIDFGELSYDDDGLIEYKMEIVYDWAEHSFTPPNKRGLGKWQPNTTAYQNFMSNKYSAITDVGADFPAQKAKQFGAAGQQYLEKAREYEQALQEVDDYNLRQQESQNRQQEFQNFLQSRELLNNDVLENIDMSGQNNLGATQTFEMQRREEQRKQLEEGRRNLSGEKTYLEDNPEAGETDLPSTKPFA